MSNSSETSDPGDEPASDGGDDNRADQLNPNNPAYQSSRQGSGASKAATDNRANQLNPNNHATKKGGGRRR